METIQRTIEASNPNQATSLANLVRPATLHWINRAAETVGIDADEQSKLMFNCSLYELTQEAADSFLTFLVHLLPNQTTAHEHEHDCAECGDTFECSQTLCNASLARYCDDCTAEALGEIYDEVTSESEAPLDLDGMILCKPRSPSNGQLEGFEI